MNTDTKVYREKNTTEHYFYDSDTCVFVFRYLHKHQGTLVHTFKFAKVR